MARREGLEGAAPSILAFLANARPQDAGLSGNKVYFRNPPGKIYRVKGWYFLFPAIGLMWVLAWLALWEVFRVAYAFGRPVRDALAEMSPDLAIRILSFATLAHRKAVALALAWLVTVPLRRRFRAYCNFAFERDAQREAERPREVADPSGFVRVRLD